MEDWRECCREKRTIELEAIFQQFNKDLLAYIFRMCDSRQLSDIDAVRAGTLRESPDDEIPESMEEPEDYSRIEWSQLLEELPGRQGVIIYMRYVEGYTAEDIGKILKMPSGTVRYEY